MMDLRTGKGLCCNIDYRSFSASTIKGPYVASVFSESLNGDIAVINSMYGLFSSVIAQSSNSAYTSLRNQFGSLGFSNWLQQAGVSASLSTQNYVYLSARELGKMWLQIYSDFSKNASGSLLSSLFSHSHNSAIFSVLGSRYPVCTKPGWNYPGVKAATNDAGIVYSNEGDYLMVILSSAPMRFDMVKNLVGVLDSAHSAMV